MQMFVLWQKLSTQVWWKVKRNIFLIHTDFTVVKWCLSLWIYGWLGRIQWNFITWKRRFIQSLKYADYVLAKRVCKDFEIKNLGEYHDSYAESNTLLLAYVFENFWNMCLEIYDLHPAKFLSTPGLAWQTALKKAKIKLNYLTDIDMLLMLEKGITEGICHSIYWYAKASNKWLSWK